MAAANVLVTLDFFGLNTALPSIGKELGGDTQSLQWIANIYLLALAAPLVAAGRIGDLVGRRTVCLIGLVVFAAGSAASAASESLGVLFVSRGVTGLGAAMITATALAIVDSSFPPERRSFAIGVWSSVGAVGSAIGPLLGGLVTEVLSWRWFFVLAVPFVLVCAVVTAAWVEESRDTTAARTFDLAGTVTITFGLAGVVFGLVRGPDAGWADQLVLSSLFVGVVLLVLFVVAERRAAVPLVNLKLFERPQFLSPATVAFVANAAFGVTMLYMTLYLQNERHLSPIETGIVFLALTIPLAVMSPYVGRAVPVIGARVLMTVGCTFLVASFAAFALIGARTGLLLVIAGLILAGIGQALAFNVSNIASLAAVPDSQVGVASGAINGVRQVGTLVGLAIAGAVFNAFDEPESAFLHALRPTMITIGAICLLTIPFALRRSALERGAAPRS